MSVVESVVVFPEPMTGYGSTPLKVRGRLAFAGRDDPMIKGERVSLGSVLVDHRQGGRVSALVKSPSRASSLPHWFCVDHRSPVGASLLAKASARPIQSQEYSCSISSS